MIIFHNIPDSFILEYVSVKHCCSIIRDNRKYNENCCLAIINLCILCRIYNINCWIKFIMLVMLKENFSNEFYNDEVRSDLWKRLINRQEISDENVDKILSFLGIVYSNWYIKHLINYCIETRLDSEFFMRKYSNLFDWEILCM